MTDEQSTQTRSAEDEDQPQDTEVASGGQDDQPQAETGGDSGEAKEQQGGGDADGDDPSAKAQQVEEEYEEARQQVKELEEDPPAELEDWPTGKAKYETLGGPEGEHGYHEGPEEKLGPSSLRHREDGSVEIEGEDADDSEKYKGKPIPGGPTDPDTPNLRSDKASPEDASNADEYTGDDDGGGEGEESRAQADDDSGSEDDS